MLGSISPVWGMVGAARASYPPTMSSGTRSSALRRADRQVREVCADARTATELVNGLSVPLRGGLGVEGMFVGATDPETTVFANVALIENLPASMCAPWMHNEFLEDDFNKIADLHRTDTTQTLHRASHGRPALSPRHQHINTPHGFEAELRTTFSLGEDCWGVAHLLREQGMPDFDDADISWVEGLREQVALAFRRTVVAGAAADHPGCPPGIVTLDADGAVQSMSDTAETLLAELCTNTIDAGPHHQLPGDAYMVATMARARAAGQPGPPPVTRVRGVSGRWLTLRGDFTRTGAGDVGGIVLVIEPARASEIMPLVVSAYGLTHREQEVLVELTSGRPSGEIATRLFISEHTVRDHVKSILAKTGTRSRGELLNLILHQHAQPSTTFIHRG